MHTDGTHTTGAKRRAHTDGCSLRSHPRADDPPAALSRPVLAICAIGGNDGLSIRLTGAGYTASSSIRDGAISDMPVVALPTLFLLTSGASSQNATCHQQLPERAFLKSV